MYFGTSIGLISIITSLKTHLSVVETLSPSEKPSCLQTTLAFLCLQEDVSHTLPHTPLLQTSTTPAWEEPSPDNLTEPVMEHDSPGEMRTIQSLTLGQSLNMQVNPTFIYFIN